VVVGEADLKRDVALAGRILWAAGLGDSLYGHVSGRLPGADRFWIKAAGKGMDEVGHDDLVLVDFEGGVIGGEGTTHREWPIHAEIMRQRPDVGAVVHTHQKFGVALPAGGHHLEPLNQDGSLFAGGVPEFSQFGHLVLTPSDGRAVAATLGDSNAVFLLNHGVVIVGGDVAAATVGALMLERACELQILTGSSTRRLSPADASAVAGSRTGSFRAVFEYHARSLSSR
jgi:L-fuculose-phosphate aldolase